MGYGKDDFVVMNFGFMTRYKGSDWLVEAIKYLRDKKNHKNIHLILAGGKAPSQTGKKHYEDYYNNLVEQVAQNKGIILTGFIPEAEIIKYFAVADLIVLPYRGILGASASWGEAISYQKPFILSSDLLPYLSAEDVQQVLKNNHLKKDDLLFIRNKKSFENTVQKLISNKSKLKKIEKFSSQLATLRSAQNMMEKDLHLYTPQKSKIHLQWIKVNEIKQKLQPAFATS